LKAQNRALKEKSEVLERINAEQKAEVSHKWISNNFELVF
jgi:hypothetical protein